MVSWQVPIFERLYTRPPVILIGMHRSGTSLLSQLFHICGVYMGRDLDHNFESLHMRALNIHSFRSARANWRTPDPVIAAMQSPDFVAAEGMHYRRHIFRNLGGIMYWGNRWIKLQNGADIPLWGWKDPRTSVTLPAWLALFPDAQIVHIVRNGIDVAISLHRRHLKYVRPWQRQPDHRKPRGFNFTACFALWETYQAHLLTYRNTIPANQYVELRYETLLQEPEATLRRVLNKVGAPVDDEKIAAAASKVNTNRLDNRQRAKPYGDVIPELADNPLMRELGY